MARTTQNSVLWKDLTADQQKQVREHKALKGCAYINKIGMKYDIDSEGNFTGGHLDPYLLSDMFSIQT